LEFLHPMYLNIKRHATHTTALDTAAPGSRFDASDSQ
jgi:hypothetical protein